MSDNQDHYLTGKLLLAMPSLSDPRFHQAVIFLCAHDENGAMGLVINHVLPGLEFEELSRQLGIFSNIEVNLSDTFIPVFSGGPVDNSRGFLLHSSDFQQDDTISIDEAFSVTGTIDALQEVVRGNGPEHLLFILGYAGWSPGQLDSELQQNSWLVADPDPDLIFKAPADEKWTRAVQKLGIDPSMLSGEAGRA